MILPNKTKKVTIKKIITFIQELKDIWTNSFIARCMEIAIFIANIYSPDYIIK